MTDIITTPAPKQSRFDEALHDLLAQRAKLEAMDFHVAPSVEQPFIDAIYRREAVFLTVPSENISDLRAKAEIVWEDPDALAMDEMIAAVFADLRRLTNNEPSRTFDAATWLAWFERFSGGWVERDGELILLWPESKKATDTIANIRWYLETRGGHAAIKALIRERKSGGAPADTWDSLVKALRSAEAHLAAHCAKPCPTFGDDALAAYEGATDKLADEQAKAIDALFAFPSPDAAALTFKMELFAKHQLSDWYRNHEFAQTLADEADRLFGQAA